MKPELRLTFSVPEVCESYTVAVQLDDDTAWTLKTVNPPPPIPGLMDFDRVVKILKCKEFRKEYFIRQCASLGELLAERMEDAEGWHDQSRVESARRSLRNG